MKRALVSVTNKEGIVEFCQGLEKLDFEIVSTGGTLKKLQEAGIKAIAIDDVNGFTGKSSSSGTTGMPQELQYHTGNGTPK